ncbi:ubiquinone anaerobic biosynthesis accessory factor UbiT [Xenorhabdus anantnagensis]|uniref:SCP2 sterol-binding domain-containing protein n=1 Tax=Xenorhabdus anantnagensis TaxID=3025875 RepID=A0ABT5LT54_9GAMM|nr:SCP2 sterol-binding domain-containing protein [Xenorhabdus anantnagensis]MDC9597520.1 SCP2 sterol-binding domain-containing protein [Xenorhabdus anantnagensis]
MIGKYSRIGPALLRFPLKATSFILQRQVQEQFLGWQFREAFNDFILIAARKEDPDTLFFQRRLRVEGNTELGLHVKNLMDSIELESIPPILRFGLLRLAEFIKAGQKEGADQNDRALSSC